LENSIQPCALLLLVGSDWRIAAVSANAAMIGGQRPADLAGQPLADLIGSKSIHALRNRLSWLSKNESEVHDFGVEWGEVSLDVRASRDGEDYLIEAELATEARLPDSIGMVRSMSDRLHGDNPMKLADQAMRQLCALTGFDRMTLSTREGDVVASAGRSLMKLPAGGNVSMIAQRVIADVDAEAVAVLGSVAPEQLAHASFLAPTLGERERLATSGIAATMSFPLRIDGQPVGSVQADHPAPRRCSAERRSVAHLSAERLVARMARQGWTP
jgi:light-regulated signal transduction histidine kinase (bacteriophytochrome)